MSTVDGLVSTGTDEFTESVAVATIARITAGNCRLVDHLFNQVQRIMQTNHRDTVAPGGLSGGAGGHLQPGLQPGAGPVVERQVGEPAAVVGQ